MNRLITIGLLAIAPLLTFATAHASEQTGDHYACVMDGATVFPPQPYPPQLASGRADLGRRWNRIVVQQRTSRGCLTL